MGPNGSGKTTLLRVLTGAVRPSHGEVELQGRPLKDYKALEVARLVGVVPQSFTLDFSFTVEEMVALGRYPHGRREARVALGEASSEPQDPVASALRATGLTDLARRPITQLSGGERQRALIAQTLAQDTPTLLLDEPLNNLDLNHQLETMQLLRALHTAGRTVVVVLHDLNMAAQYCDELILLDQGRVAARGTPAELLDPRLVLEVFKTRVSVHRQGRRPYVTPVWSEPASSSSGLEQRRVHVLAGGGAASSLLEEMVLRGFTPSVGVVSVFDTDYATAQTYGLEVVSAPPFEPFTEEAMRAVRRAGQRRRCPDSRPRVLRPGQPGAASHRPARRPIGQEGDRGRPAANHRAGHERRRSHRLGGSAARLPGLWRPMSPHGPSTSYRPIAQSGSAPQASSS